jgi:metallo-beta-lactamase family protein
VRSSNEATGLCGTSTVLSGRRRHFTGSKYLLDDGNRRILVDCGLFQGFKALRLKKWAQFPLIDTRRLDSVILSHAHFDRSGYLHGW